MLVPLPFDKVFVGNDIRIVLSNRIILDQLTTESGVRTVVRFLWERLRRKLEAAGYDPAYAGPRPRVNWDGAEGYICGVFVQWEDFNSNRQHVGDVMLERLIVAITQGELEHVR